MFGHSHSKNSHNWDCFSFVFTLFSSFFLFFFLVCYFSKIKISISTPKKSLLRFSLFSPRDIFI